MKKHFQHKALCTGLLALMGLLASNTSWAQVCTREYAPVCGQVTGESTPRTFANSCLLNAAQAAPVAPGECTLLPMTGSGVDAHGCKGSAGYQWNAELSECVRPWMRSVITLEVGPKRRPCTGVVEMQCLMVRERADGKHRQKWQALMGTIVGFDYVPGKRYKLRVRKDHIENPPADAPDTTYTLLKVLR